VDGNATFGLEILASPWACCLLQISVLLLLAVVTIGCILKRFPGIAATIGLVVMTACVGLTLLTLVGIPRPLDLAIAPAVPVQSDVVDRSNEHPQELVNQKERSTSGLFERSMSAFFRSGNSLPSTGKPLPDSWAIVKTTAVLPMIVVVSFAFAIFRLLYGIVQIRQLVSTSQPLIDSTSQSILDQLLLDFKVDRQTAHRFSVRSFRRPGSPFVTWMTGNTIYVPRSFVNWSETEKQACLAHEQLVRDGKTSLSRP